MKTVVLDSTKKAFDYIESLPKGTSIRKVENKSSLWSTILYPIVKEKILITHTEKRRFQE